MLDTREITSKEQCDLLNIFKDNEETNTWMTQQEVINIKYGGTA